MHIIRVCDTITKLKLLSNCTILHLRLHSFDDTQMMNALFNMHKQIVVNNIHELSNWLYERQHQPPLSLCSLNPILPMLMITTYQSRNVINTIMIHICKHLNDSLRQFNNLSLQELQLRKIIIRTRNSMEQFISLNPLSQTTNKVLYQMMEYS